MPMMLVILKDSFKGVHGQSGDSFETCTGYGAMTIADEDIY
jgi:hypothetical protein